MFSLHAALLELYTKVYPYTQFASEYFPEKWISIYCYINSGSFPVVINNMVRFWTEAKKTFSWTSDFEKIRLGMVGRQVIKTYTAGLLTVHCEQDKTFS